MADALVSPAVGGTLWLATAGVTAYCAKRLSESDPLESRRVPVMGVMGAFVFAAQMINFSIPVTGSSGHLGGGLLLAAMLGPQAGFLAMAAVLTIQALFFADGGLLALGCNVFNLGFLTCFVAYPFIFRPLLRMGKSRGRVFVASVLAAVAGLQMGAFGVVLETLASGKTELPFGTFVLLMQPIHLAIGLVEGLVTAAVLLYMQRVAPESIAGLEAEGAPVVGFPMKGIAILAAFALVVGGALSWFASSRPDGLEWSMFKTAGVEELEARGGVHKTLGRAQERTAFLPDYDLKDGEDTAGAWPAVDGGKTVAGIVGSVITLAFVAVLALGLSLPKRLRRQPRG